MFMYTMSPTAGNAWTSQWTQQEDYHELYTTSYPRRLKWFAPMQPKRTGMKSATTTDWDFIKTGSWQCTTPIGYAIQKWWSKLGSTWRWVVLEYASVAVFLVVTCCSLYCCCGLWAQGAFLWAQIYKDECAWEGGVRRPHSQSCRHTLGSAALSHQAPAGCQVHLCNSV
jgi:hypothetical protein